MCDKLDIFLINLYKPQLGRKIKSVSLKNLFNNKYENIYKLKWNLVSGPNRDLVSNGVVILDRDIILDISVNLSVAEKCDYGVVLLKNDEIIYASETDAVLNFNIVEIFKQGDKIRLLILTNNDIKFFDLGCSWYLGTLAAGIEPGFTAVLAAWGPGVTVRGP